MNSKPSYLALAGMLAVEALTFVLLAALHADGTVAGLAFILILVVGADTCTRVAMRYPEKRPDR